MACEDKGTVFCPYAFTEKLTTNSRTAIVKYL